MNSASSHTIDRTFQALSDPTRRAILARLAEGDAKVTDLAAPFDMSLNAVSKHVRVLEDAGFIQRHVKGREHRLSFDGAPLREASDWIDFYRNFWDKRLDSLARFLAESQIKDSE